MDLFWNFRRSFKRPDGTYRFARFAKAALLALTIPHSNAQERVFGIVAKNKTKFRLNFSLDGTLPRFLSVKLAYPKTYFEYELTKAVIDQAKKCITYTTRHILLTSGE